VTTTIWKFSFATTDLFTLEMPARAKILTVQIQNGMPQMWAEVDPHANTEERHFAVYGTGHRLLPGGIYIGTYQQLGTLVFHVYEVKP
jgi:hypothetical protein